MKKLNLRCKSVFQNGNDTPNPEQMTQRWAALIEQMERTRHHLPVIKAEPADRS